MSQKQKQLFFDRVSLDKETKRLISMRDGVLEYLGGEIGMEPEDQVFTVYRSPAALANASRLMDGLPIVDGHMDLNTEPNSNSKIIDTQVVQMKDEEVDATLAASHKALIDEALQASIETGKQQVSLGYTGDLVEHPEYGLEQVNIEPHHLALEYEGRCGSACSFIDKRQTNTGDKSMLFGNKNKKQAKPTVFKDDDGNVKMQFPENFFDQEGENQVNMQQIVEIASALPEAIKNIPVDKLQEVFPQLQELVQMAKENDTNTDPQEEMEKEDGDYEGEDMKRGAGDKKTVGTQKGQDSKNTQQGYTDAQMKQHINDAVAKANQKHAQVIEKARDFVDSTYNFTDKSTEQIMKDVVATQSNDSFEGDQLEIAFKMLQPPQRQEVTSFGDRNPDVKSKFDEIADKEL